MDPDQALADARAHLERAYEASDRAEQTDSATDFEEADHLFREAADKYAYLDGWLSQGGFLPRAWSKEN